MPEEVLDGEGYVGFFLKCVYALSMEKIVRRSPKGQKVLLLLDELLKMEHMQLADILIIAKKQPEYLQPSLAG